MMIVQDNVYDVYIEKPQRMFIRFIRRFIMVFDPLNSFFDFATFGVLLWLMKAGESTFHTGCFIGSMLSAGFVVFAMWARLLLLHSKPGGGMLNMTLMAAAFVRSSTTRLWQLPGFSPLPPAYPLAILGIVFVYFTAA